MALDRNVFLQETNPLVAKLDGLSGVDGSVQQVYARAKEFSTGSLGWYGNTKTSAMVGGEEVQIMLSVTATIMGTKPGGGATTPAKKRATGREVCVDLKVGGIDLSAFSDQERRHIFPADEAPVYTEGAATAETQESKPVAVARSDNFAHVEELFRSQLKISDVILERHFAEVFFFPDLRGVQVLKILNYIRAAKKTLDVCVYALTDDRFRNLLVERQEANVRVRVLTDLNMAKLKGSDALKLHDAGVSVLLGGAKPFCNMHHKFAVLDGKLLLTGSFNWTVQASRRNQENMLVIVDPELVDRFSCEFERLWSEHMQGGLRPSKQLLLVEQTKEEHASLQEKEPRTNETTLPVTSTRVATTKPVSGRAATTQPSTGNSSTTLPANGPSETPPPVLSSPSTKAAAESPATMQTATERPTASQTATERPSTMQTTTERPAIPQQTSRRPATTQQATEHPTTSRTETVHPTTKRPTTEPASMPPAIVGSASRKPPVEDAVTSPSDTRAGTSPTTPLSQSRP